jgi:hypothetical protein
VGQPRFLLEKSTGIHAVKSLIWYRFCGLADRPNFFAMPSQNSFTPWWNSPRGEAPANRLRKGKKPLNFEEYASEGNRFVNEVARELNTDRNTAARILRVVLHAVRDRLPADDAIQFAQGLPIALKGVFIDQYDPSRTPVVSATAQRSSILFMKKRVVLHR